MVAFGKDDGSARPEKVFLTSAYPLGRENFGPTWLTEHSGPLEGFELVDDPESADIIIFVENHPALDPYFFPVRSHELNRRFPEKCVLHHDTDRSVTTMRTVSPSVEHWQFDPKHKATYHYIARFCENPYLTEIDRFDAERKYLFSFDGSTRTNPMRRKIMELDRPDTFLVDRGQSKAWEMTSSELVPYQRAFVEGILASHFVLCPSGVGPASFRLFEAMQLARPPVIIADRWVPIEGPDWESVAVFVPESEVMRIPEILEARRDEAEAMGRRARAAWERYFSPEVSLQRLCEASSKLVRHPYGTREYLGDACQFLAPYHLRGLLRYFTKQRKKLWNWKANWQRTPAGS